VSMPGGWELVFLAVLALLIFGPNRLPEIARGLGKAIGQFKREAASTMEELKAAAEIDEYKNLSKELKDTTVDLKRSAALTGPIASAAGAEGEPTPTVKAGGPPPFDPDAT
jgi:sec-independent protein translocase protein TatB